MKCHKLNKYFKFILLTSIFRYFNVCLLGYNFNESFVEISFFKFLYECFGMDIKTNLSNFRMIEFFFNYIGTLFFSFLSRIYELKITKKKVQYFFKFNESFAVAHTKIAQMTRENIMRDDDIKENILSKFKNYLVNNTSFILYVIISFIWVADELTMFVLFNYLKDVDFWFFEILIVTYIYSKIFLVQIYKHQKFAIILNLIPSLLKITCIILTLSTDENIIYSKYHWWIFVGFLCHSTLTAIISFINCSLKSFLDLKYTTASQLLMFYSSVGIIMSFLICIISTYVPCSSLEEIDDNYIINIMCHVKDNAYTYFDNFKIYFSTYTDENSIEKFIRTIIIILDSLTFFLFKYFFLLSIKYTDPVHIYFYIPIYYVFQKTILVINNAIKENACFKDTSNFRIAKYFLDISGDFFCLIGFLIYIEVIELNFCGLNYNLKLNISQRGKKKDSKNCIEGEDEEFDENEKDGENDNNNDDNEDINIEMSSL